MSMKSGMKCDVEISITADGQEYETMTVPPCLQAAAMEHTTPEKKSDTKDMVKLPHRYVQKLEHTKNGQQSPNIDNDMDAREKDLDTALKWIKQEILQMKEQDKCLMKQFIDLRSSIVQLRYMHEFHSSNSDVSSFGGSNASLDDVHKTSSPSGNRHYLSPHDFFDHNLEFRARTSSLLTPRKSPVTRIKWKSNEFI